MARNEWINGYLEAILDAGAGRGGVHGNNSSSSGNEKKRFEEKLRLEQFDHDIDKEKGDNKLISTTKYFVEEVVNGFDESDLYRTWIKVIATRNTRERTNRLENMCWRIWHLARKKKQIAWDDEKNLTKRRREREKGRKDAADDLSDLSEGEREKGDINQTESPSSDKIPRITSDMQIWSDDHKSGRLYIVLISLHGLVRGENMELGRDSDTGGQVKYVVELARALANMNGVYRVDLLTRQISSSDIDSSYGEPIEMLSCPSDGTGSCGAYIIRIPCGPRDKYMPKESLWPHIPEFVDGALGHIVNMARVLGEQVDGGKPTWPYVIHSHYADAGEVAARLSGALNVPMVLTGHSLGRNKFEQLLQQGRLSREDINSMYKIMRRIEAEELALDAAEMVVTSTRQEIDEQWGLYDGFDVKLERKLRVRRQRGVSCLGRHMARMVTLILGNRDDIEEMANSSSAVLTTVLKLIDKYDLYGQVAYPKHHKQSDVPEIYRLAAKTKGVFINPALVEPFGLTLIEAAAYGLPIVATKNGGPVDILKALNNGLLIDPHDQKAIADALLKLVADKNLWVECRKNGLKNINRFSWPEHCRNYLSHVENCRNHHPTFRLEIMPMPEEPMSDSLRDVEDLSLKFSIDADFKPNGDLDTANRQSKLIEALTQMASSNGHSNISYCPGRRQELFVIATDCYHRDGVCTETLPLVIKNVMEAAVSSSSQIGFLLLTGLTLLETKEILKRSHVRLEDFDALVCNSGSTLYYPWRDSVADMDYEAHIEYRWPGENVRSMIMRLGKAEDGEEDDILEYPDAFSSRCYSYIIKPGAKTRRVDKLRQKLRMRGLRCNIVYTHAASRLNVVPLFASRAQTLRYLSVRWGIDLSKMVVFVGERGDTDYEDLLVGLHKTVILRNSVEFGSEMLLRSEESFKREDVVPQVSPSIAFIEGHEAHDISAALKALQIL
ncbi:probable sucrose-phosphate synthase 4 isoform X3 [Camellia sinensis]|uniref:probable sucrose-phosphate synthase 4 isoform X3 n=1 Tax=Camellia sinensis TaxID=4442 RepID=UPI0010367D32|nr:probable sucrose-phosphate synthase 4 isoform X3 [Camellia sinensis]